MSIESVDTIKRRMIRNASKIWGYHDIQDLNSFDPVLGLLMGALAEELYAISNKIENTEGRIVEKLLEILFSGSSLIHFPAHAIVYAKPLQPKLNLADDFQLYYTKQTALSEPKKDDNGKKEIYFTPSANCTLYNSEIKYMVAGRSFFEIDGSFKELTAETDRSSMPDYTKIHIGVKFDSLTDNIDGFSLFLQFKNTTDEERYYQLIHSAKWKINGVEVVFNNGFGSGNNSQLTLFEQIRNENNISSKTCNYINNYYSAKFMTLKHGSYLLSQLKPENAVPGFLSSFTVAGKPVKTDPETLWIEMELSQPLTPEEINEMVIYTNCFPVVNRQLVEYTYPVVKGTNIIPLSTDELFLDVKSVTDSNNHIFLHKGTPGSDNEKYTYVLRQGGTARFNKRDAKETIQNLISLIRDEAAAFQINGTDLLSSELKQLDQIISRLKQRIDISNVASNLDAYLVLESEASYDKIFVEYWTMSGELANNIRPGSKLNVRRGADFNDKNVVFITQTVGGKHIMLKEEKINTLRSSLLSQGRVVTVEDVKALSIVIFGSFVKNVEVEKGVFLDPSVGKGMSRCLDVFITLNGKIELSEPELKHRTEDLKRQLIQKSTNILPYRVFVKIID
ncbi:MAG TPA: hypothetical protein DER09_10345 [Prolixibacteraceae bacterium]|nr:hypothetical protein [Prolixibacteraceae bacterium]